MATKNKATSPKKPASPIKAAKGQSSAGSNKTLAEELRLHGLALTEHSAALRAHATAMATGSAVNTDAIVNNCISMAANGAGYGDDTPFSAIPLDPNDMNDCLNSGLDLAGTQYEYTTDSISSSSTPRKLRVDGHNRYLAAHSS